MKDKTNKSETGVPLRHAGHEPDPKPVIGTVKDESKMNEMSVPRARRTDPGLGSNSDIGAKLRAFYGAVQDQPIPDKFLDLLEKLDQVEQASKRKV